MLGGPVGVGIAHGQGLSFEVIGEGARVSRGRGRVMTGVSFGLLGPIRVWSAEKQLGVGPPQQRGVLALLLLSEGRRISLDEIVGALWGRRHHAAGRQPGPEARPRPAADARTDQRDGCLAGLIHRVTYTGDVVRLSPRLSRCS
jgi:hypothetical protein